jgi:hypothetical protein
MIRYEKECVDNEEVFKSNFEFYDRDFHYFYVFID